MSIANPAAAEVPASGPRHALRSAGERLASTTWLRRVAPTVIILVVFVGVAVLLRGGIIRYTHLLNPDEAELLAEARAAMRDPVPFTTWTTGTTGPVWAIFLALLGWVGFPLTVAFAHLVAAVLYGLIGAFGYLLARRTVGRGLGLVLIGFLWLPLVLTLTGLVVDFGPLATELLPAVLVLGAALIAPERIARRPWLYLISGLLGGLAVGAKYQALPIALAVLAIQVVQSGDLGRATSAGRGWRGWLPLARRCGLWVLGAAAPFLILGIAMLASPHVDWTLVGQVYHFLTGYSGASGTLRSRVKATFLGVTTDHLLLLGVLVAWLGIHSTTAVRWLRAGVVAVAVLAVFAGGHMFGHYLLVLYTALILAIGLPVRPGTRLLPRSRSWVLGTGVAVVALVAWLISFGPTLGGPSPAGGTTLRVAFSSHSVNPDPRLAAACPADSEVLVWGWAPEMYVDYSWRNAIPVLNTTLWSDVPSNHDSAEKIVVAAIEDPATTCVVDAVGTPFFDAGAVPSLTGFFPATATTLASNDYQRVTDVLDCDGCSIYVRGPGR